MNNWRKNLNIPESYQETANALLDKLCENRNLRDPIYLPPGINPYYFLSWTFKDRPELLAFEIFKDKVGYFFKNEKVPYMGEEFVKDLPKELDDWIDLFKVKE